MALSFSCLLFQTANLSYPSIRECLLCKERAWSKSPSQPMDIHFQCVSWPIFVFTKGEKGERRFSMISDEDRFVSVIKWLPLVLCLLGASCKANWCGLLLCFQAPRASWAGFLLSLCNVFLLSLPKLQICRADIITLNNQASQVLQAKQPEWRDGTWGGAEGLAGGVQHCNFISLL